MDTPHEIPPRCLLRTLGAFVADERAVTSIEYGLIATLTALAAVPSFNLLGAKLSNVFSAVGQGLEGLGPPPEDAPAEAAPNS